MDKVEFGAWLDEQDKQNATDTDRLRNAWNARQPEIDALKVEVEKLSGYRDKYLATLEENAALAAAPTPPAQEDSVKIPTSPEEAELMAKLGMVWLQQNAPDRLNVPAPEAESVASLTISHFRGHLENRELDYYGDLPDGTYKLYTHPASSGDAAYLRSGEFEEKMTQREHFERLMKQLRPNMPLDYNEQEGYYYHDMVSLAYQAYIASPKTRPTEPSKITKEQLDAMKTDTTDIVDHLRGIYAGAASRYPVTPLMMLAADEIERLRDQILEARTIINELSVLIRNSLPVGKDVPIWGMVKDFERKHINKKPAEAG